MKITKTLFSIAIAGFLLGSCSVLRKKEKLGCPNDMRNMSQDEIVEKSAKKKYKAPSKF